VIGKRHRLAIALGVVTCLLCVGPYCLRAAGYLTGSSPTVERTSNVDSAWHRKHFESRLLSLQREDDSAAVVYGRKSDLPNCRAERWTIGFTINRPDRHGSTTYTVDSIDARGVCIAYQSSFDHRSFGKNLISEDSGGFRLPWISVQFVRYEGRQPPLTVTLLPGSDATEAEVAKVREVGRRVFNQVCATKTEIWPEPAAIVEQARVWSVRFRAKTRVLTVNGRQELVEPGPEDGMMVPLMKPDLTCVLVGDPLPGREASERAMDDGR
jgi:hypothetical protein